MGLINTLPDVEDIDWAQLFALGALLVSPGSGRMIEQSLLTLLNRLLFMLSV